LAGRLEAREKAWEESPEGRQWAADIMAEANAKLGVIDDGEGEDEVFEDIKRDVIDEKAKIFADDDLFDPDEDTEEVYFKDKDML
jgi:hypothetical protein